MYISRNFEARSCNHCSGRKLTSITYYERVSVALVIQHVMRMRHIIICGLPDSTIFFSHYLIKGTISEKKVTELEIRVLIFSTYLPETCAL
jgi:hypothetical protein